MMLGVEEAMKSYSKFLPRLLKFRHLEFDSALQQVLWTVICPKRVFRYHQDQNEMRGYWARDDPAFLLLLCLLMSVSAIGYALWLRLTVSGLLMAWLWTLLSDCVLAAVLVATVLWVVSNKMMLRPSSSQMVEWAYCFDVHLNAFFPFAIAIFGLQMILYPLLSANYTISLLISNTLWIVAMGYYIYVTFLGYTTLPSTHNTVVLLSAMIPVLLIYMIALPMQWNFTSLFTQFFSWRTVTG